MVALRIIGSPASSAFLRPQRVNKRGPCDPYTSAHPRRPRACAPQSSWTGRPAQTPALACESPLHVAQRRSPAATQPANAMSLALCDLGARHCGICLRRCFRCDCTSGVMVPTACHAFPRSLRSSHQDEYPCDPGCGDRAPRDRPGPQCPERYFRPCCPPGSHPQPASPEWCVLSAFLPGPRLCSHPGSAMRLPSLSSSASGPNAGGAPESAARRTAARELTPPGVDPKSFLLEANFFSVSPDPPISSALHCARNLQQRAAATLSSAHGHSAVRARSTHRAASASYCFTAMAAGRVFCRKQAAPKASRTESSCSG